MSALDGTLPKHPHLIHPHTGQPLQAIGVRRNGELIWPQLGAAPDDEDDTGGDGGQDDDTGDDDGSDDDKPLGEAGQKALTAEKEKRRKAADRARAAEKERDDARAELARLKAGKPSGDDKPDADEIRRTAREEVKAETLKERVLDKIEAKAAARFEDPEDAVALLARRSEEFIDDGKVDVDSIVDALDELLQKKPHLGKQQGKKRPDPDRSQGAGKGGNSGNGPSLDEQIAEAEKAGEHLKVIRLQRQKLQPTKSTK
jgi:hypothetical protein